jgi:hypothetical protein
VADPVDAAVGLVDHLGQRDAVQPPQLSDKAVGGGPSEQGLLDLGELLVGQPGRRAAGPLLRSPSVPVAFQRRCQTLTA